MAWIIPSWIVFEAVPTKLPHYVLPLFPAIALLTGGALSDRLSGPLVRGGWRPWLRRAAIGLWGLTGLALGALAATAAPLGDGRLSVRGIVAALAIWGVTGSGVLAGLAGRRQAPADPARADRIGHRLGPDLRRGNPGPGRPLDRATPQAGCVSKSCPPGMARS